MPSGVSPRASGREKSSRGLSRSSDAKRGRSAAPSGLQGAAVPGSPSDIPLARRSRPATTGKSSLGSRFRWTLFGSLLVGSVASGLVLGPLRPWLAPPPVAGLNAKLSSDGRLLGHLPYPEAPAGSLVSFAPGMELRKEAATALVAMRRAAADDGVNLSVVSAFRSLALQRQLFFDVSAERNQSPQDRAKVSAPPGFSEHSTGFAVDLADAGRPDTNLSSSFESTPAFAWLSANAARFHFLLSFPKDNRQGVNYEPWHWRYEGSTEALRLFEPAHRLSGRIP